MIQSNTSSANLVPKALGFDVEFANFLIGFNQWGGTSDIASKALLKQIEGMPQHGRRRGGGLFCGGNPQDVGRKWTANSGGFYIDLQHIEAPGPLVRSALDSVASWRAAFRILADARRAAEEDLPQGVKLAVIANSSDGRGHSYGAHRNFCVSRRMWKSVFQRKAHLLAQLASMQIATMPLWGIGRVGSENGAPDVPYSMAVRPAFLTALAAERTTFDRPWCNTRFEPWGSDRYARYHAICFDCTAQQVGWGLTMFSMQCALTMLELGRFTSRLIIDDPVRSGLGISLDPSLRRRIRMADGRRLNVVELLQETLDEFESVLSSPDVDETVIPDAATLFPLLQDTVAKLRDRDWDALARRLDWVLKKQIIERAMQTHPEITWDSPQARYLDDKFAGLDDGLLFQFEADGLTDELVTPGHMERFVTEPPEDTRGWTHQMAIRFAERAPDGGPYSVDRVEWDEIRFRVHKARGHSHWRTLSLDDPLAFTRADTEQIFAESNTLDELLDRLESFTQSDDEPLEDRSTQGEREASVDDRPGDAAEIEEDEQNEQPASAPAVET